MAGMNIILLLDEADERYGGRCIGGPYDGQHWMYPAKRMWVTTREGAIMREGYYEFGHSVWRWHGSRSAA